MPPRGSTPSIPASAPAPKSPSAPKSPPGVQGWKPRNRRKVLCVFPRYSHSFGTFDHAFPLMGVKAFMPPQGILLIAAYLPAEWEVRFIDENVRPVREDDFRWADAVLLTGMHVQREQILAL